jgi:hypothetical protein
LVVVGAVVRVVALLRVVGARVNSLDSSFPFR